MNLSRPGVQDVDAVQVTLNGAIAEVTLNRPRVHNALNLAMWHALGTAFTSLGRTPGVRAVIVRGAGDRAFSAGADISEFKTGRVGSHAGRYNAAVAESLKAIRDLPVPVLAMVRGLAVGGGCEIAASCDLRIVADDAKFGIPIMRLGVTLGTVEAAAVVGLIGPAKAKDLLFTGRLVDAHEALQMGLVDRVVTVSELEDAARTLACRIASGAPGAARVNKLTVNGLIYGMSEEDEQRLQKLTAEVYDSSDLLEGITAFEEKRDPIFKDE